MCDIIKKMKKKHKISGIVIAVMGLLLVGTGAFSFQFASADSLAEQVDSLEMLLIVAGAILVIIGIVLFLWIYSD
jgi:uncharacterized membrane protein YidH (DUF202 family)